MKPIRDIDALGLGRKILSGAEREKLRRQKFQQQKEKGYQQLAELCRLGEYDAAKQLANRNPSWKYEIICGIVMEKIEE
ncbi:MAG: hypothetical protein N3E45_14275 [Oscillatoriaceae bacterium SKW80]|nr:hypothetical protein [Oscillatoriaceae bacterium SKYG93]MCX8121967.1 hypothetical protein [Oscillatoriaceae bacterium SKW80]MDW8454253.1 hypothetical protein [Oscillatoriaceae cyanobacterium SKYGB_i_bin93]HIK29118.1 hypothetical protein [Oscillatoriaceae cyanobacterium M7585_C2015_266]